MKNLIVLIALIITLSACGKAEDKSSGGSSAAPVTKSKSLFNPWTASNGRILELSNGHFGANSISFLVSGGYCNAILLISGTEEAGNASTSAMTYSGTGDSSVCSQEVINYTYTKTMDTLTTCRTNGDPCTVYK